MKSVNVLTIVVLLGGSGCLLGQSLMPDLSTVRHRDAVVHARLRRTAARGAREAQAKGDARALSFYREMMDALTRDPRE